MKVLITGGTGFLGGELVKLLAPHFKKVYLLCRRPSKRISALYAEYPSVELVKGDITGPDIIEDVELLEKIKNEVDTVFHGAAFYDIEGPYSRCFMYNVVGTQNVIYLINQCKKIKHVHYISTVAVAGNYKGLFREDQLNVSQNFNNHYSKTKYDAEVMMRNAVIPGGLQIYRLGILTGHSETGEMKKIDGPYYFLKLLNNIKKYSGSISKLKLLPLPYNEKSTMPFIPVDEAAKIVCAGLLNPEKKGTHCYHVIGEEPPFVREFVEDSLKTFGIKLSLMALPKLKIYKYLFPKIGIPKEMLLYMYGNCTYDTSTLEKKFKDIKVKSYKEYSGAMYGFAKRMFQ